MALALQIFGIVMGVLCLLGFIGDRDRTQRPYYLAAIAVAMAIIIAADVLL